MPEIQPAALITQPASEPQPTSWAAEPAPHNQPAALTAAPEVKAQPVTTAGEYVSEIPAATQLSSARPATPKLQLDMSSGLTQIETDPDKLKIALVRTQQEQPAPLVKRVRAPLPPVSNEPLIQVETGRPAPEGEASNKAAMQV
jgi:ribonuclease E